MHIGFRKDFSKKRSILAEGAWGGVGDKCKVGSLNYFCILATYLLLLIYYIPAYPTSLLLRLYIQPVNQVQHAVARNHVAVGLRATLAVERMCHG